MDAETKVILTQFALAWKAATHWFDVPADAVFNVSFKGNTVAAIRGEHFRAAWDKIKEQR